MDKLLIVSLLKEIRETLQFENDTPDSAIRDTIWMMHRNETLFDFLDRTIELIEKEGE